VKLINPTTTTDEHESAVVIRPIMKTSTSGFHPICGAASPVVYYPPEKYEPSQFPMGCTLLHLLTNLFFLCSNFRAIGAK
jgi:hypothetical protein